MIKAEIIAVGSELLSPFRIDTNSLYLARTLEERGISIVAKTVVGDDLKQIVHAFSVAFDRSDVILSTGGLGPTVDDLTRDALAEYLGVPLLLNESVLQKIEWRFSERNIRMPEMNRKQAMIPQGGIALENHNGTAPGIFMETRGKQVFLLPGPPFEMEPMWEKYALPLLRTGEPFQRQVFRIAMMPESKVDEMLQPVTQTLKKTEYTILASPAEIEIHLLAPRHARAELMEAGSNIRRILGNRIFAEELVNLEEVVARLLRGFNQTVSVAESCTGGLLGHRLTQIPGSSQYFERGVIVYSNVSKNQLLQIPYELIEQHGAVSAPIAITMAEQIRFLSRSDYGIGITGIAGPDGGTPQKPVGLVYVALADLHVTRVEKYHFPQGRDRIKFMATQAALNLLRLRLIE
ncbi:competence/damage-inducible protein A [bacterium]|nr:competence/damage-inducible protein A [bacterium]